MYYTGIDLHKKTSFITTVDEQGQVGARRNLPNQLPVILNYFCSLTQLTQVVIESMGSWYWLYDALREAGHEVMISNPCKTKAIASAAGKDRHGRITKQGSKYLRTALIEAAQCVARLRNCRLNVYFRKRLVRSGYSKAVTAKAHKILQITYYVLKNQQPYQEQYAARA